MSTTRNSKAGGSSKKKGKKRFKPAKLVVWFLITCALGVFCAMAGYLVIMLNGEKYYEQNKDKMAMDEAAVVFDVAGNEVMTLARENRELVTIQEIPVRLTQAFIATEDKRFNEHSGIDFWSIGRALYKDILHRSAVEGGSTITQQLAKNMFLNADKTVFRKANEAAIALALENNLTKEKILEMYLNRIYFGKRAYGIKAAAKTYFGKSDLNTLEVWEMATLAAIPKAPSYYNPIDHPDRSKERRAVVLQLMRDQGYITEEERAKAAEVEYTYKAPDTGNQYASFIDFAINEAAEKTGKTEDELLRGGYDIYTTLDVNAQKSLEDAFGKDALFQKNGPNQKMQAAMVILNHKDGGIVGMIGGRDYKTKDMNRAVRPRQPGSSFKPIIAYAPAMEKDFKKWNPYSMLVDEKMSFGSYSPSNWDNVYLGKISMAQALHKSANVASVWLLNEIGVKTGMTFASKLGIPFAPNSKDENLAIALGGMTYGVSPLQMATAYSAFANNGLLHTTHSVTKVVNADGTDVYKFKDKPQQVMQPRTAWYMTEMLKAAVDSGTGASAKMNRPVAGKTGTTQLDIKGLEKYNRDVWFAGYTPEWTAAVWMGFDNTDSKHYVSEGSARPAVMFREVMSKALAKVKVTAFERPKDVPELKAPPQGITDLAAVFDGKDVILGWSPINEADIVYRVFRKGSKEKEAVELPRVMTPSTKDMSVLPGDTYEYYVIPYRTSDNVEGERSNSAVIEVRTPENSKPGIGIEIGGNGKGNGNGSGNGSKPETGTGGSNNGGTGTGTGTGTGGSSSGGTGTGTGTGTGGSSSGGTGTGTGTGTGGSSGGTVISPPRQLPTIGTP